MLVNSQDKQTQDTRFEAVWKNLIQVFGYDT